MAGKGCRRLTRRTVRGWVWWLPQLFLPFHWLCWRISIAASSLHPLVKGSELCCPVAGTMWSMFSQVTPPGRAHSHVTWEGLRRVRRGKKHLHQKRGGHRTPEPALSLPRPSLCLLSRWPCSQSCSWSPPAGREKCSPALEAVVMSSAAPHPPLPWPPNAAVTALGLSLHSLTTVCLPHRPASSSWDCPPTLASWSWLSACATPSTTADQSTWTTTCSRETWTTLRAPTLTTDYRGCHHPSFFSIMFTSSLMLIHFYGNYIDVLGTYTDIINSGHI